MGSLHLPGLSSEPSKDLSHIHNNIIQEYLENGYSLIPIDHEKRPYIYWKQYQYQRATINEIVRWQAQFNTPNIGIVTGYISQLAVVDVDELGFLPKLKERVPQLKETTRVKTRRGYHYYFKLNGNGKYTTSVGSLFGRRIELKSNGNYIVAPPSVIRNHRYTYEVPLSKILPIPEILLREISNKGNFEHNAIPFKIPRYHGYQVDCIRQILRRELKEGERDNSLFILYNLLLQNKNSKEHAQNIVTRKNNSLSNPLPERELNKIFRKAYHYSCSSIREKLLYVCCENCSYRFRVGRLGDSNILIRSLRLLPELTNTQRGIACLLGTVFDGENPSINRIANVAKMNYNTVKKAIQALKEKDILDDSLYN